MTDYTYTDIETDISQMVLPVQRLGGQQILLSGDARELTQLTADDSDALAMQIARTLIRSSRQFVGEIERKRNRGEFHTLSQPEPHLEIVVRYLAEGFELTDLPEDAKQAAQGITGVPAGMHHVTVLFRLERELDKDVI